MRRKIGLVIVLVLPVLVLVGAVQASEYHRVVFKGIDALAIECDVKTPTGIDKDSFEKSIKDLALVILKSKLPKIEINDSSSYTLYVSVSATSGKSIFISGVNVKLIRLVHIDKEQTFAPVYTKGYIYSNALSKFEVDTREVIEELLAGFIADFYRARPDL